MLSNPSATARAGEEAGLAGDRRRTTGRRHGGKLAPTGWLVVAKALTASADNATVNRVDARELWNAASEAHHSGRGQ
ncbi:hypothetical protein GCM10020218_097280 [Dactylosporangium vinaceum]